MERGHGHIGENASLGNDSAFVSGTQRSAVRQSAPVDLLSMEKLSGRPG